MGKINTKQTRNNIESTFGKHENRKVLMARMPQVTVCSRVPKVNSDSLP